MKTYTAEDFKRWGAQGPKRRKTNRTLTPEQAKAMVAAREKKRLGTLSHRAAPDPIGNDQYGWVRS